MSPYVPVTQQQLEVLALVASGKSVQQVAAIKNCGSDRTVYRILDSAVKAANAQSVTHLCALCVEAGLIVRSVDTPGFEPSVDPYVL